MPVLCTRYESAPMKICHIRKLVSLKSITPARNLCKLFVKNTARNALITHTEKD